METLKKLKKHDHTLTDIIKAFIFGLVLLAPCFAILTKCLYVINNKNAYQSYSKENMVSKLSTLNSYNQAQENDTLYVKYKYYESYTDSTKFTYNSLSFEPSIVGVSNDIQYVSFKINNYFNCFDFYDSNNTMYRGNNNVWGNTIKEFYVEVVSLSNTPLNYGSIEISKITYYTQTLDNVFYESVDEMKDSQLFGWTKETGIYTAVNAMCSGLAVQDGALPVLITYWTLMTAIYIILDIVIFVFKKITHIMQ